MSDESIHFGPCKVCGSDGQNFTDATPEMFIPCCPGAGVERIRRVVEKLTPTGYPSGEWYTQATHYACDACGKDVFTPDSQFAHVQKERMVKR